MGWLILIIVCLLAGIVFLAIFFQYFSMWVQCWSTGAGISLLDLIMMRFRKVDSQVIVGAKIMAVQTRLTEIFPVSTRALEAHYLANGNVKQVIQALVAAHRAKITLDWQTAAAIDLAGRNILDAVRTSVYPKVIDCPDQKTGADAALSAVCGDGIELRARARVTVRTNLEQLVGGATEETIVARVGQGIVQAIGKQSSYKSVLENPELISETVLELGLEKHTSFEIVSIDIADIDVGDPVAIGPDCPGGGAALVRQIVQPGKQGVARAGGGRRHG